MYFPCFQSSASILWVYLMDFVLTQYWARVLFVTCIYMALISFHASLKVGIFWAIFYWSRLKSLKYETGSTNSKQIQKYIGLSQDLFKAFSRIKAFSEWLNLQPIKAQFTQLECLYAAGGTKPCWPMTNGRWPMTKRHEGLTCGWVCWAPCIMIIAFCSGLNISVHHSGA